MSWPRPGGEVGLCKFIGLCKSLYPTGPRPWRSERCPWPGQMEGAGLHPRCCGSLWRKDTLDCVLLGRGFQEPLKARDEPLPLMGPCGLTGKLEAWVPGKAWEGQRKGWDGYCCVVVCGMKTHWKTLGLTTWSVANSTSCCPRESGFCDHFPCMMSGMGSCQAWRLAGSWDVPGCPTLCVLDIRKAWHAPASGLLSRHEKQQPGVFSVCHPWWMLHRDTADVRAVLHADSGESTSHEASPGILLCLRCPRWMEEEARARGGFSVVTQS